MLALAPLLPSLYGAAAIVLLLAGSEGLRATSVPRGLQDAPTPIIEAMAPDSGALSGGDTATLTGVGLTAVTGVEFAGQQAEVVSVTNSELVVTVPAERLFRAGTAEVDVFAEEAELPVDLDWTYVTTTPVDRQLEYAFQYWKDYNVAAYGDFNLWGGDCMNFVSQTLVARGWVPSPDWFNSAQQDWAPAFVHVPSFDEWLAGHPELGAVRLGEDDWERAKLGDVVVLDWDGNGSLDHAQVISRISSPDPAGIEMVGHNVESTYRSIEQALDDQGKPAAQVWIWSIP